jgi:hypothetical protein
MLTHTVLCRQDVWHAIDRIDRELDHRHVDYRFGIADIRNIYKRLRSRLGDVSDPITTVEHFCAALDEWLKMYIQPYRGQQTEEEKLLKLAGAIASAGRESQQVRPSMQTNNHPMLHHSMKCAMHQCALRCMSLRVWYMSVKPCCLTRCTLTA